MCVAIGCCNTKENTSWNMISCEVNQTGRGREHSDDNVPSDKSGYTKPDFGIIFSTDFKVRLGYQKCK